MKKIETEIKIELSDLKEFNSEHINSMPFTKVMKIIAVIIFLTLLFSIIVNPTIFWVEGILTILLLLLSFALKPLAVLYRSKKNFETEKNFAHPIQISISEQEVALKGKFSTSAIDFKGFYKFRETENLILMYYNKFGAFIIPKRDLTKDQLYTLRELIN